MVCVDVATGKSGGEGGTGGHGHGHGGRVLKEEAEEGRRLGFDGKVSLSI